MSQKEKEKRKVTACYSELMPEEALTSFTVSDAFANLRVRQSY